MPEFESPVDICYITYRSNENAVGVAAIFLYDGNTHSRYGLAATHESSGHAGPADHFDGGRFGARFEQRNQGSGKSMARHPDIEGQQVVRQNHCEVAVCIGHRRVDTFHSPMPSPTGGFC